MGDGGREGSGRGLLYRVKHLKSTRVVTVKETITKYLTCTASKPAYLPYCREHRALPTKLNRSHPYTHTTSYSGDPHSPIIVLTALQ